MGERSCVFLRGNDGSQGDSHFDLTALADNAEIDPE